VVVHLPQSFPFLAAFRKIAMGLGASPGQNDRDPRKIIRFSREANDNTGKPCRKSAAGQWLPI